MRMGRAAFAIAMGALVGAQASCIVGGTFVCTADAQCSGDGVCESTGWCSFPDSSCSSGARYSPWAGDDLANDCTDDASATTGATSQSEGSDAGESSGPPVTRDSEGPVCGDGITEVGEDCDDMNGVDGDGCNTCVASGTVRWTNLVENGGEDEGRGVVVTSSGLSYVAGLWGVKDGQGWLLRFEPDGSQTSGWKDDFGNNHEDAANAIALLEGAPDDCLPGELEVNALFVAGFETPNDMTPESQQGNETVRRYDDADSSPLQCWSYTFGSQQTITMDLRFGDDKFDDVEIGLEEVVAFGHLRLDLRGNDADATATGVALVSNAQRWTWTAGLSGDDDFATAGVVDDTGRVWAVGRIRNNDADAWIAHIAVEGTVGTRQWTWTSTAAGDDRLIDLAILDSGNLLAVGRRDERPWIAVWEPLTETAASDADPIVDVEPVTPGAATLRGVAIDGAGRVVVVGDVESAANGNDAWVQKLQPDLETEIWSHQIDGSAHGNDFARAVAIAPDDAVVVVGDLLGDAEDDDGVDRDVWIEAYEP
jgi:cysteine-rich repeat protein